MESICAVILCGGKGSRLEELTGAINKPLICIGNAPIVFHVAFRYWKAGARKIYLAAGWRYKLFKVELEKQLKLLKNDIFFEKMLREVEFVIVNTGEEDDTFSRVKKVASQTDAEHLLITYGDTITDIDCSALITKFSKETSDKSKAVVSIVQPEKRFSSIEFEPETGQVKSFTEKEGREDQWVGCGYILLSRKTISELLTFHSLETEVLPALARKRRLFAFCHVGIWRPIDYVSDVKLANEMFLEQSKVGIPSWLKP